MGEALYDEIVGAGRLNAHLPHLRAGRPRTTTWSPIWCAACSRTAPTPPSSTAWPTTRRHLDEILRDPVQAVERERGKPVRLLPRPMDIFSPERLNSRGIALTEPTVRAALLEEIATELSASFEAAPIVGGEVRGNAGGGHRAVSARPARAHRHGAHRRCRPRSRRRCERAAATRTHGTCSAAEARAQILDKAARPLRARPRAPDRR